MNWAVKKATFLLWKSLHTNGLSLIHYLLQNYHCEVFQEGNS